MTQTFEDAFNLLCNDKIGSGIARVVYDSVLLPDCVIKVEQAPHSFQNIIEWQVWQHVSETEHSKWFAQCRHISPCGRILVMEKTRPALEFPEKIPAYFTDTKRENFGVSMLPDPKSGKPSMRFVCHDYGCHLFHEFGMTKRMKNAEWWDL